MLLANALSYLRNRHNDTSSNSYWSDTELYTLMTSRCNEILSIIGLIEKIDTSQTAVSGTQSYNYPTLAAMIKKVVYNGYPVQQIQMIDWEAEKAGNVTASGRPKFWFDWADKIWFVPIPDESTSVITIYYEKEHPLIDNSAQTTIDIPSILHYRMLDGVLADMYSKDVALQTYAQMYEQRWASLHIPAFYQFHVDKKRRGRMMPLKDSDSSPSTDHGAI